jgi:hypothetical protein
LHLIEPFDSHVFAVKSLTKKYTRAVKEEKDSQQVFQELDSSVDDPMRQTWSEQERMAFTHRGEHLKIYQVQMNKGQPDIGSLLFPPLIHFLLVSYSIQ